MAKRRRATVKRTKRVSHREELRRTGAYGRLVDGGYYSFVIGANYFGSSWSDVRHDFKNDLIIGDSWTRRKDIYPEYKATRKTKRDLDPKKAETYRRVRELREYMKTDNTINYVELAGAEADDGIIALSYRFRDATILGQDKDLAAAPLAWNRMWDHKGNKPTPPWAKSPKYQSNCKLAPWSLYLRQALTGDSSDNIKRLLPSKRAQLVWAALYDPDQPMASLMNCVDCYGDDFILNLKLVLIPTPLLLDKQFPTLDAWFTSLINGDYWLGNYFDKFCDDLMASLDKVGSGDDDDDWGLD